jgi:hypothetical protein
MTFVLFHIATGAQIQSYRSESSARKGLRSANRNAGWTSRISRSWTNGIEMEWCFNGSKYDHAPYGITEQERWETKFSPSAQAQKYIEEYYE